MKTTSAKLLGSVASSVLLVSAGAAAVVPAMNAAAGDNAVAYAATAEETSAIDAVAPVMKVQGDSASPKRDYRCGRNLRSVLEGGCCALREHA